MATSVLVKPLGIETELAAWLSDQTLYPKMVGAFLQKGGWEGWAQVEFGNFLTQTKHGWTVEREVAVYTNTGQRADLLCRSAGGSAIVELKVETLFQSGSRADDFVQRVEADVAKLGGVATQYAAARKISVGISIAAQTTQAAVARWTGKMTVLHAHAEDVYSIAAFYVIK